MIGVTNLDESAVVEPADRVAHVAHEHCVVADQQDCGATLAQHVHVIHAPPLKLFVADGDDLVDQQDLRVDVDRHRKAESDVHAARVDLHRFVDEVANAAEVDDLVHRRVHVFAAQPEHGAIEVDVLSAGEIRVESRPEFEQGRETAFGCDGSLGGAVDVGHQSQQGRFAAAVVADQAEERVGFDVQVDVSEYPEVVDIRRASDAKDGLLQAAWPVAIRRNRFETPETVISPMVMALR